MLSGLLSDGVEEVHAFEPHPQNVAALREQFGGDRRVVIHDCGVSDFDGHGDLHLSQSPSGSELPFGHTLLARADTDQVAWSGTLKIPLRRLGSLVDAGLIPRRVGLLKIDTEGHDLAVVRGMGDLEPDLIMLEHWSELPHGLGRCPWTIDELTAELGPRGFRHFAFILHCAEYVTLKWDDGDVEAGAMGNLLFLSDDVLPHVFTDLLHCASVLTEEAIASAQIQAHAASERLQVIEGLKKAANERLALIEELTELARPG